MSALEKGVAYTIRDLVRRMEAVARALRTLPQPEAAQHADELTGAARIAQTWAQELEKGP